MDALIPPTTIPVTPAPRLLGVLAGWLLCGLFALHSGVASAEELPSDCGELSNRYGPYDYTNPEHFQKKLPVVEKWHFTKEQELSTYQIDSKRRVDLDYTLRAFPNHHRALMALTRTVRMHPDKQWEVRPECYYLRALAWRPQDGVSRMIYGLYLHQQRRLAEAEQQYKLAISFQRDYAEAYYNLGLLYADQKRWPDALAAAHRAYALNYPLPGLRNRLMAAAAWQELPAPAPEAKAADTAAPATSPAAVGPETVGTETADPAATEGTSKPVTGAQDATSDAPPTPVPANTTTTTANPPTHSTRSEDPQ